MLRRQSQNRARHSRLPEAVERGVLGLGAEHGDGDRLHVAPRAGCARFQVREPREDRVARTPTGEPAVAEVHDPLQRVTALATEEDWRGGLLYRPPPQPSPNDAPVLPTA